MCLCACIDAALKATALDLNTEANRKEHHTNEYEQEELIVRRGQAFNVTITFSKDYNPDNHKVIVQLTYGNCRSLLLLSLILLSLISPLSNIHMFGLSPAFVTLMPWDTLQNEVQNQIALVFSHIMEIKFNSFVVKENGLRCFY